MNPRLTALLVLAIVLAGGYWLYAHGDESWRQKMIVTVSTSTGEVSGEAVTSVYVHKNNLFKDGAEYQFRIKGEAVVVDLGLGKHLFVLLSDHTLPEYPEHVAKLMPSYLADSQGLAWDQAVTDAGAVKGPITVPERLYPLLVMFTDSTNPRSVKEVKSNNLPVIFGPGYTLTSMKIEITSDYVTYGNVEKTLAWLSSLNGKLKPTNKRYVKDLLPEERLYSNSFRQE